jgi:hypothetical protein
MRSPALATLFAFVLTSCGGGSATEPTSLPTQRVVAPTGPVATTTPLHIVYPAAPPSRIRSTYGRIALAQIFDYFRRSGSEFSPSQIRADGALYDWVWGSYNPQPWHLANPQAPVSRYYIVEEDNTLISGHGVSWWKLNHPDWMLYTCDASGKPTRDLAYVPGVGFPDVVLNLHNPLVVRYQISQNLIPYALAHGYTALALDEVILRNFLVGGNPNLGQTIKPGEYACGTWNADGAFTKVYTSPDDPTFAQDIVNWVASARQFARLSGLAIAVNHPVGSISDPNEKRLIANVDIVLDESGFTDYGNYGPTSFFASTYRYAEWAEQQGVAMSFIQKYENETTSFTPREMDYALATYLMVNEGNADMFLSGANGPGYGYGAEQYHPEFATPIGAPCAATYGGASYDAANPDVYYRRFEGGMAVADVGTRAESATLPASHAYADIEKRSVSNPLSIGAHDAYVLTTSSDGCH